MALTDCVTRDASRKSNKHPHTPPPQAMPPIYSANRLGTKSIQSPDFIQRGLDGLNTGRLEDIHMVGLPDEIQPPFPQYIGNISAFLTATATQRKVICGGTYLPVLKPEHLVPIPLPPLTLLRSNPLSRKRIKLHSWESYRRTLLLQHTLDENASLCLA